MNQFKDFIKEQFMIARTNMPQIEDIQGFVEFLDASVEGTDTHSFFGYVDQFKPLQAEGFNEYKVRNIAMDMRKDPDSISTMKPIIVSEDGYVIDGHHRYLAATREKVKLPYIVVYTTANKLLKLAYEFTSGY